MNLFTRARGLLAAVMLVACMALVACGGDDDKKSDSAKDTTAADKAPATTEAAPEAEPAPEEEDPAPVDNEFAAEANSYCEEYVAEAQALAEAGEAAELVSLTSQLTENIAALEPPAGQEETFNKLIELARANDAEAMRIVEDGGTIDDIAALDNPEADALAAELGLTSCG